MADSFLGRHLLGLDVDGAHRHQHPGGEQREVEPGTQHRSA
jgi:hypothetical protein